MPLPLILGIGAAIAGAAGVGTGVRGAVKMKEANDVMKSADRQHKRNLDRFEKINNATKESVDKLGTLELNILKSFEAFSDTIEKIQNRPKFKEYTKDGVKLPTYNKEDLKEVSIGTGILRTGAVILLSGVSIGGWILSRTGKEYSDKAYESYGQMKKAEETINATCDYLVDLLQTSRKYYRAIEAVNEKYLESFNYVSYAVNKVHKTDWNVFTEEEKTATENAVLLVGLLYKMCQVSLVNKAENDQEMNTINKPVVDDSIRTAERVLSSVTV